MLQEETNNKNGFIQEANIKHVLKSAKHAHENYLIRATEEDLEKAIDCYIQVIKIDPSISEAHYKLASLLWAQGQIDINSALKQCWKAVKLKPNSPNARLYMGFFLKAAGQFKQAEHQFKRSVLLSKLFSAKPRIALAITIFEKMHVYKPTFKDSIRTAYYLSSGVALLYSTSRCLEC